MRRLLTTVVLFLLCLGHINTISTPFFFLSRHRGHVNHGVVLSLIICPRFALPSSTYGNSTVKLRVSKTSISLKVDHILWSDVYDLALFPLRI